MEGVLDTYLEEVMEVRGEWAGSRDALEASQDERAWSSQLNCAW